MAQDEKMYYEGNVHSTIDSSFVVYESTPIQRNDVIDNISVSKTDFLGLNPSSSARYLDKSDGYQNI